MDDLRGLMEKIRKFAKETIPDYSSGGEAICVLQICDDEINKLVEKYK